MLEISYDDIKRIVNEATDENGLVPENLECIICQCLVYDPILCFKCGNALYCKMCI